MRHGKKFNHLSRKSGHRKAMLSNMASSLIKHKRIKTTVAKAKALRTYVEPLMTKSKNDTVHSRRTVFSYLQDKFATKELFDEVSARIAERPGGYTRILKTGFRIGDGAEMCIIELVDYNTDYTTTTDKKKTRKRRTRRGGSKVSADEQQTKQAETKATPAPAEKEAQAEEVDDVAQQQAETAPVEEKQPKQEETPKQEEKAEESPKAETKTEEVEEKKEAAPKAEAESKAKEEKPDAPREEKKPEVPKDEKRSEDKDENQEEKK